MPGPLQSGQLFIDIGMDYHAFEKDLDKTARKFDDTLNSMQARVKTFAKNVTKLFHSAITVFGGFAIVAGVAVNCFVNLQDAQIDLRKRMDATNEEFDVLTEHLARLSTHLPTTRKELVEIATAAAKVGVATQNIAEYAVTMKKFAIATGMAGDKAAIAFKRILNVTGQTVDKVENLGSALAVLLDQFPTSDVESMVQVMTKMGRSLGSLGVKAQGLAGLAAAVASISQRVARPASQLRKLFVEMAEEPAKYARAVGVSAQQVTEAIQEGPINAVMQFIGTIKKLYKGHTPLLLSSLEEISETSVKAILPLVANFDLLRRSVKASREEFVRNERLQTELRMEMNKLSKQIRVTYGNFKTFAQTVGSELGQAVGKFNKKYLKPLSANLVEIALNSEKARKAIAGFIKAGLKISGIAVLVGGLAKMFAMLLSPVGIAIVSFIALFSAWEYNILGVREALNLLGEAWGDITDLDTGGLGRTLTELFSEAPVGASIALSISAFTIARLAGGTIAGMLATGLTAIPNVISAGAATVAFMGGLAVAIILPLMIKELTCEQNKKELLKKWKDSGIPGKVQAVVANYPLTTTAAIYVGTRWGGLLWGKFVTPALSWVSKAAVAQIPWLTTSLIGGVSVTTIALTAVTLALSIGAILTMYNKFKESEKSIAQQVMENLGAALVGGLIGAGFGSVLGRPIVGAAIGIGMVSLLVEITRLIPAWNLGGGFKKDFSEEAKDRIQQQMEKKNLNLEFNEIDVKGFDKRFEELDKLYTKFIQREWGITDFGPRGGLETLEQMKKLLKEIKLIKNKTNLTLSWSEEGYIARVEKTITERTDMQVRVKIIPEGIERLSTNIDLTRGQIEKLLSIAENKLPKFKDMVQKAFDESEINSFREDIRQLRKAEVVAGFPGFYQNRLELLRKILSVYEDINEEREESLSGSVTDEGDGHQAGGPITRQQGGFVPGTGSGDKIPAMLEPGEFVWDKELVQKFPDLIKGTWEGFKKGGPVSQGTRYYGPGSEDDEEPNFVRIKTSEGVQKVELANAKGIAKEVWKVELANAKGIAKEAWKEEPGEDVQEDEAQDGEGVEPKYGWLESGMGIIRNLENIFLPLIPEEDEARRAKFKKDIGAAISLFKNLKTGIKFMNNQMENMKEKVKEMTDELKDMPMFSTLWGMMAAEMGLITRAIQNLQIGEIAKDLPGLFRDVRFKRQKGELVKKPKDLSMSAFNDLLRSIPIKRQPEYPVIKSLQAFDKMLKGTLEELFKLKEIAKEYGFSTKELQSRIDNIKQSLIEAGVPRDELTGIIEKLTQEAKEVLTPLGKLAKALGLSSSKLGSWIDSTISSLTSLIAQTGVLTNAQSKLMDGMVSVTQSLLKGNWVQAIIQGITALFSYGIAKIKSKIQELEKKLDAAYNMVNNALREFGNQLSNVFGGLLGPFSSTLSGAIDGLLGFVKMIQLGGDTIEGAQSAFSALLSIATGLLDSFVGLIQKSSAWQRLQEEVNPIWQALANAFNNLIWPIVALVDWVKDFLGIAGETSDTMQEIADAGVAQGFKRARVEWRAAEPGELPTTTEEGKAKIPAWAKKVIKPLKTTLRPILKQIKKIDIAKWLKGTWSKHIIPFLTKKIPQAWGWLEDTWKWLTKKAPKIWGIIKEKVILIYKWFKNNFKSEFKDAMGKLGGMFDLSGMEDKLDDLTSMLRKVGNALVTVIITAGAAIIGAISAAFPWALFGMALGGLLGWWFADLIGEIPAMQSGGMVLETGVAQVHKGEIVGEPSELAGIDDEQDINVRLDIDGRELNSRLSEVDRRKEYTTHGSTRGKKGGYGRG